MAKRRDPVETAADESMDLYDVATWEKRTSLDRLASAIYRTLVALTRTAIVLTALLILVGIGGLSAITDPQIGALTLLSAIPALGLAAYVWYSDVTTSEPLSLLVATFLLGVLTANFAAVVNSLLQPWFQTLALVGNVLFFYVVVGPIEETVKLLAVRLYAFGHDSFDAVVDGAVYGAMAGLGFATIENALYITRSLDLATSTVGLGLIGAGGGITAVRALAGPGHVIYSAFAGYYLGLAKFNPRNRGPVVVKGLLIATFIHATYNATVGVGSAFISISTGLPSLPSYLIYVLAYDGLFGLILLRKIRRYSEAHRKVHDDEEAKESALTSEMTEFES
ncbi:MAG: PrsW family intramembrane metalloprotease [Haloferacaceae archaeon]